MTLQFTVLGTPHGQGSMRGVLSKTGKVVMKADNPQMKPYRQEVGWTALRARNEAGCNQLFAGRHAPVALTLKFVLAPPKTIPKGRTSPSVKPDLDKACRAVCDALTGILWNDDGQVVALMAEKVYGLPERTEITVALK